MNSLNNEVAELIIETLNIEDLKAEEINPDDALFNDGLGLDSIDALELGMALSMKYGFQLKSDDPELSNIFSSLNTLSAYVESQKK